MPAPKILVVDDSRTVRVQVQRILSQAGYEVVLAEDGNRAIELLSTSPALMILDVVMPGLDGYGVCEKLKELNGQFDDLPIVFLTSLESHAMELLGREYGAYLHKPVQADELLAVVQNQLQTAGAI